MFSAIKKGTRILREEGLAQFSKRFLVFLSHNSFSYGTYYLFRKSLTEKHEWKLTPKTSDYTLKIIRTASEVDKLIENGFNFGYFQDIYTIKEHLNKGTILFCVFIKEDWAHSSWLTIDNSSIVDPFFKKTPFVDAGIIGLCATNPAYRGLGLYPFVLSQICEFLQNNSRSIALISTAKKNIPSINGIKKAGFSVYAEGYHLNIGLWTVWKEKHQIDQFQF